MIEENEDQEAKLKQTGREMVYQLHGLIRTAALHDMHNKVLTAPLEKFREALEIFLKVSERKDGIMFVVAEEQVYIGDHRVKLDSSTHPLVANLAKTFTKLNVGGLKFAGVPNEEDSRQFFNFFSRIKPDVERPDQEIQRLVKEHKIKNIDIAPVMRLAIQGEAFARGGQPKGVTSINTYAKSVAILGETIRSKAKGQQFLSNSRLQRIIQELIDVGVDELDHLISVATVMDKGSDLARHGVRVAILAIALGTRLGVSKSVMSDLGLAALLHDFGKSSQTIEAPKKKDPDEPEKHSQRALLSILDTSSISPTYLRQGLAGFQHHLPFKDKGNENAFDSHMFSNTIAICNDFAHLIDTQEKGLLPVEAVQALGKKRGTAYNPVIFDLFVNVVGRYPVGAMVRLSNGEIGTVQKTHGKPGIPLPLLEILDKNGKVKRKLNMAARPKDRMGKLITVQSVLDDRKMKLSANKRVLGDGRQVLARIALKQV